MWNYLETLPQLQARNTTFIYWVETNDPRSVLLTSNKPPLERFILLQMFDKNLS